MTLKYTTGLKLAALGVAFGTAMMVGAGAATHAWAQDNATPENTPPAPGEQCQADPHFNDWDFWLGEWTVTGPNGNFAGTNSITAAESGCMIHENWTGAGGGTGYSMNFYNPHTGKWRQIWVSGGGGGYNIDYEGGLNEDGAMALEGHIYYYGGESFPFRGTWSPFENGDVRQLFEIYAPDKDEWVVWFDGRYSRSQKED